MGKANSLKKRVNSYFKKNVNDKLLLLQREINDLDFIVTNSEIESLILEDNLIKKYLPKYNAKFKDGKTYPFLEITISEKIPRVQITRKRENNKNLYFGPFTPTYHLKETLKIIQEVFKIATCHQITAKTKLCLYYQINKCSGPCENKISITEYQDNVKKVIDFLKGKNSYLIKTLEKEMLKSANNLQFEKAANIREQIKSLTFIQEKQTVVLSKKDFIDVIAIAYDQQNCAGISVLNIREGKINAQQKFFLDCGVFSQEEVLNSFLKNYYLHTDNLPTKIILPFKLEDINSIKEIFKQKNNSLLKIIIPFRGEKKELLNTATKNAQIHLQQKLITCKTNLITIEVLTEVKNLLKLKQIPFYIEGFDVSNIFGEFAVGSMVTFINAQASIKNYRHYKIKTVKEINDYLMLQEILKRRYLRLKKEKQKLPDLILIDGGKGHLQSALQILQELNLDIPTISIAKKEEIIYTDSQSFILPKSSKVLQFIQQVRNEAHRFAINYHKKLREKDFLT